MAASGTFPTMQELLMQSEHSLPVMVSNATLPTNQGYYLRFYIEGWEGDRDSFYLCFWFGQFILLLNTSGVAQLYQAQTITGTAANYAYVFSFRWAESGQVHSRYHNITIMPHGRNKIEFITGTGHVHDKIGGTEFNTAAGKTERAVYTLPGTISYDSNNWPIITQPNRWAIRITNRYQQHLQVGRMAFYNGNAGEPSMYDAAIDPGFTCNVPITFGAEYDASPSSVNFHNVIVPGTAYPGAPWTVPGRGMQYWFSFSGDNKWTAGDGTPVSSSTPEWYGYAISKPPGYRPSTLTPVTFEGLDFSMDTGASPEEERAVIKFDNTGGRMDNFTTRAQINVEINDPQSGLTLFEGVGYDQTCPESTADNEIWSMTLPCRGMSDQLSRSKWSGNNPNFGNNAPDDPTKPWLMGDVIRRCFAQAGFDSSQVVIEEEAQYLSQFRCWMGQQAGGPTANTNVGDAHEVQGIHSQWQPSGETSPNEYLNWLLRHIMGWHFHRSKADKKWHVYRRPNPLNATDVALGKFNPKVGFYRTVQKAAARPDGLPSYYAGHMEMGPIHRPAYTTVQVETVRKVIPSAAEFAGMIAGSAAGYAINGNPDTPLWSYVDKVVYCELDNKYGYVNPLNNPPNLDSPDFIGARTVLKLPMAIIGMNDLAMAWAGRRVYEDNCRGYVPFSFEADWGDQYTYNLRKYDCVLVETRKFGSIRCTIDRIEPFWNARVAGSLVGATPTSSGSPQVRRAKYRVIALRLDGPPPL